MYFTSVLQYSNVFLKLIHARKPVYTYVKTDFANHQCYTLAIQFRDLTGYKNSLLRTKQLQHISAVKIESEVEGILFIYYNVISKDKKKSTRLVLSAREIIRDVWQSKSYHKAHFKLNLTITIVRSADHKIWEVINIRYLCSSVF